MRKNKMTALLSLACAATLAAGVGVVVLNAPVANAETAHTEAIFMANGASIRYSNPSGIRFVGYVDEDVYTQQSVVGMKISVGGVEKDFSTATETVNGAAWQWAASDVEGYKKFQVAITGIPETEYGTELTAQAYVDGTKSAEIVTRSIANVAVAALAADTLEDKLLDGNVTKLENYVNDAAVALPFDATEVSVTGGNLTFDAVENAKGYLVQMGSKMTNIPATSAETYSVPVGDFEGVIKMLPYGDGVAYRYAETACAVNTDPTMIVGFDDASYVNSIGMVAGEQHSTFKNAPTYAEGKVAFGVNIDDYRGGTSNWSRLAAFTVALPEALNLQNGYNGIRVKIYLNEITNFADKVQKASFELLDESKKTSWNDKASAVSVTIGDGVTSPTGEMELFISNAQLAEFGYATGDKVLTFAIRGTNNTNANTGDYVDLSIDYVKYYAIQDVLSGGLAADELANFNNTNYTSTLACVGGETYKAFTVAPAFEVAGTPEGTVSFTIRNDDYRDPHADWTNIAAFTVTLPKALNLASGYDGIRVKLHVNAATKPGKLALELLDDSKMTSWCTSKSSASVSIGEDDVANTGWLELFVSNAQLADLGYATGDTVLTFGLRNAGNASAKYEAHSWNVSFDFIKYYSAADLLVDGLATNELANFNDGNYTSVLAVVQGEAYKGFKNAPSYADGMVSFGIRNDDFRNPHADWTNIAAFTVSLPKALDLTKGDGIEVKLIVNKTSQTGKLALELLDDSKQAAWNTTKSAVSVSIGEDGVANTGEMVLSITNEQLAALGYATGDTVLTFGLRNVANASAKNEAHYWEVSIDYIEYYKEGT